MRRLINILLFLLVTSGLSRAHCAETASSVLRHVVDRMSSAPVEASFSVEASGMSQAGTLTLSGNKFVFLTDDLSAWYDGKNQWTLSKAIKEVNITHPTHDELAEINPLLILGSLSSNYNAEMATSAPGRYEILLVSRDRESGIASARVAVNSSTWMPQSIDVTSRTGEQFKITIKNIKNLKSVNESIFRFNPASYPGVEIIDLR